MILLVDTSVWSLALRRDRPPAGPQVDALAAAITGRGRLVTTGIVLQELLQGVRTEAQRALISARVGALPLVQPDVSDHEAAAEVFTTCRRAGVQLGTVDALLVALCRRHDLTLLTTDADLTHASRVVPLRLWVQGNPGAV